MPILHDSTVAELDSFVEAYEDACASGMEPAVEGYLPVPGHPHFAQIAGELLRVDLELSWQRGAPTPLADYRRRFPVVLADTQLWSELAFEEFRLRLQAGHLVAATEYRERHGVDTSAWPKPRQSKNAPAHAAAAGGTARSTHPALAPPPPDAFDATVVQRAFPNFALVQELGRGSFGCVYLAREQELAGRHVALKVAAGASVEPERLAQLQHANIVPIYSVHQAFGLQAVCMPFLGHCTLADVVGRLRTHAKPPQSGQDLLSTIVAHADSTTATPTISPTASASSEPQAIERIELVPSIRDQYRRSTYVDAVVWIAAQMAAGLAHAHERGILHRDLKPANVLLADDGRPMLLDFNLADCVRGSVERAALVGGTIPYMAPEQLDALETGVGIDARSDIFSLGVVLFELLTRQLPFPSSAADRSCPAALAAQRRQAPPSARAINSAVPRSLDGIVARCLAPRPELRYQTAEQLRTDLERHLANLPLAHAPDRDLSERCGKWFRRHPRLSSAAGLGTAAAIAVACLGVAWSIREQRVASIEADANFQKFLAAAPTVEAPLSVPGGDPEILDDGIRAAHEQLARYGVAAGANWQAKPSYARLTSAQQRTVDGRLATTLYLLAAAHQRRAAAEPDVDRRQAALRQATEINDLALEVTRRNAPPLAAAVGRQRLELTNASAMKAPGELAAMAQSPTTDAEPQPVELLMQRRYAEALPLLIEWRDRSPTDLTAWLLLGNAHAGLGAAADAEECFTTAIAQRPKFSYSYFLRGLARYEQRKFRSAADDFTMVLKLGGCPLAARVNRALALHGANELDGALADLDAALKLPRAPVRLYFVRAQVRRELGDAAGALQDFQQGLSATPDDADSWLARGMARIKREPESALSDFRRAAELDPASRPAMQNIVHVLADRLDRESEALPLLDELISAHQNDARILASRAMIHARLGNDESALADAALAMDAPHDAKLLIQLAGVFALVAGQDEARVAQGLALLAEAVRDEPSLVELAASDPDLAPLRARDEFNVILESARVLRSSAALGPTPRPAAIP